MLTTEKYNTKGYVMLYNCNNNFLTPFHTVLSSTLHPGGPSSIIHTNKAKPYILVVKPGI